MGGDLPGGGRAEGGARPGARRDAGDRPVRPDARRDPPRLTGKGAAARHPLERRALGRRVHGARGRGSALAPDHRQPRDAGLHRAEADVGGRTRARGVRARRHGAAAQGLPALPAERGPRGGDVRRIGDPLAGCGEPPLVGGDARRHRTRPRTHAPARGRLGSFGQPFARPRPALGPVGRSGHCGRGRRQRGRCGGDRDGGSGPCLPLARHVGRAVRRKPRICAQSGACGARVLSLLPGHLASDVGDTERRRRAGLGGGGDRRR